MWRQTPAQTIAEEVNLLREPSKGKGLGTRASSPKQGMVEATVRAAGTPRSQGNQSSSREKQAPGVLGSAVSRQPQARPPASSHSAAHFLIHSTYPRTEHRQVGGGWRIFRIRHSETPPTISSGCRRLSGAEGLRAAGPAVAVGEEGRGAQHFVSAVPASSWNTAGRPRSRTRLAQPVLEARVTEARLATQLPCAALDFLGGEGDRAPG